VNTTDADDPRILAELETCSQQGMLAAQRSLDHAIGAIDDKLGEGYARRHPELLAAFLKLAATNTLKAVQSEWKKRGAFGADH
jgi:hypothetical protein